MHHKLKIIILLAVVLSVGVLLLSQTSFFKGPVLDAADRYIVILAIIVIVLGLSKGIFLITNKEIKKEENSWIRIKLMINPFLMVLLTFVLLLSMLYFHFSSNVEFVLMSLIPLCVLISGIMAVIWLIKWTKNKNKTTLN